MVPVKAWSKDNRLSSHLTFVLVTCALLLSVSMSYATPVLFDRTTIDLGDMQEGQELSFVVKLRNISDKTLNMLSVDSSCGCTEARFVDNILAPGETGTIEVTMDTTGKSGHFLKVLDITTDTTLEPTEIFLTGNVLHNGTSANPGALFSGKCARCHIGADIEGKSGQVLYDSVCYICHKDNLPEKAWPAQKGVQYITESISNGLPATSMPAFARGNGGPLTDTQIKSLVSYLIGGTK